MQIQARAHNHLNMSPSLAPAYKMLKDTKLHQTMANMTGKWKTEISYELHLDTIIIKANTRAACITSTNTIYSSINRATYTICPVD